ncbi:UvrD-helicase domain-containing protein [Deinococcus lacus]|uniref:DNA 3'-5' helicase n=1 Tax=Deinococcus lacus TaxID=392561 RepID=A0ABW1YIZ7_9DEIO
MALGKLLALDLEFDTAGFQCGALVGDGQEYLFGREDISDVGHILSLAAVVGHNIRRFDLPKFSELLGVPLDISENRLLDTLELASLLWPGRPTQALEKLYRETQATNDPVADCQEALELVAQAQLDAPQLPAAVRYWTHRLLPQGALTALIPDAHEDWLPLTQALGDAEAQRLRVHLQSLPAGQIENLGAVVFLHWSLLRRQPSHRRPVWVERTFPSFLAAEAALGPLDLSEEALTSELQDIYGPAYGFRDGQLEIVQALLGGEVVPLGLLPTGGGKSLTFQFPALLLSRRQRALTVIVSPLTALMEDQVINLQLQLPEWGERAAYLSGTQTPDEQRQVLDAVWEGRADLLYLSPERLRNPGTQRLLTHRRPAMWILDEAHTFSQWGMDFRPDFLRIARAIREIHQGTEPPLLGLVTATATQRVVQDLDTQLVSSLGEVLGRPMQAVPGSQPFQWRSEIATDVQQVPFSERLAAIRQELVAQGGAGVAIVYVRSRRLAELYAEELSSDFRAAAFHGGMAASRKKETLEAFKRGDLDVVVATNAFGMGIDRAGIHLVLHAGPPQHPESYLQEIGRVARKPGETGRAVLYWDVQDFQRAFEQEKESRIGNSKSLRSCWDIVRGRLKEEPARRWVSSFEFGSALGMTDPDDLTTQARVALYALEAYGLMAEGESQPGRLSIRLEKGSGQDPGEEGRRVLSVLQRQGAGPGDDLLLDIRELAMLAALRPNKVVTGARQLVRAGYARWSYQVSLRQRRGVKTRLERVGTSLRAMLAHLDAHPDADLNLALKALRALEVARARFQRSEASLEAFKDAPARSQWTAYALGRLATLQETWKALQALFEKEGSDTLIVNAADLDSHLPASDGGLNAMEALTALEQLGMVDMARADEMEGRVFYLDRGQKERYSGKAFEPLELHYRDRTRHIHAMRLITAEPTEGARIALMHDYFALSLDEFCHKHFPDPAVADRPQMPEYAERIFSGLSPQQLRVVDDDQSRAILVLAGPGSGKTRTIVHRVANLVVLRGVSASRVLVLAYNTTAVAEVRERLAQLIGPLGIHIDVMTFHGLARKLTGLTDRDARDARGNPLYGDAAHAWLLGQVNDLLDEQPSDYDYVLVDEYQDVDELKYGMITRLAGFDPGAEEEQQRGYLVAVGDDDQNLYGFQGADIRYIQQFQQDYQITDEKVIGLVDNYRSAPEIVATANAFIGAALPSEKRLKTEELQIRSARHARGQVYFGRYGQRYYAAHAVAAEARRLVDGGTPAHEIAVLAPQWHCLEEVEHALREVGLSAQQYGCDDQLRPAASLIGQHILGQLRHELTRMTADAAQTLRDLSAPYSQQDRAFAALLAAVEGLSDVTYETLALRLESARPLGRGSVVLSSYHSAKGSEFTAVFVLDERTAGDEKDDATRALYVALTRARERLYLIRKVGGCHSIFTNRSFMEELQQVGVRPFEIDRDIKLPERITFTLALQPGELWVSCGRISHTTTAHQQTC